MDSDLETIYAIINDSAQAYRGVIPQELWRDPFMPYSYLHSEINQGVHFWGYEEKNQLDGVMGIQNIEDVTLIRHSYVRTSQRRRGIGSKLIRFHLAQTQRPILVGCLKAMTWAISFYQKHNFTLVSDAQRDLLRSRYWSLPSAHVRQSVVLVDQRWLELNHGKFH